MKDIVFISHANPEDNYFAFWLSSKLKQAGYSVWVDINNLVAGDSTWPEIEKIIREQTIRFVAVISNTYINKAKTPGSGIRKEISCASVIQNIPNFMVPVRLDQSKFSDFNIDILELYATDFNDNWKQGLTKLLSDLEVLKTPKSSNDSDIHQFWINALKINQDPLQKTEQYRTNWFEILLPKNIYIHQPTLLQNTTSEPSYKYVNYADRFIAFASEEIVSKSISLQSSVKVPITLFSCSNEYKIDNTISIKRPNYLLVQLLNSILRSELLGRGLSVYKQANKKEVFHFDFSEEHIKPVSLKKFNKARRTIIGQMKNFVWHFGISYSAALFPKPMFKISYHIIFKDDKGNYLSKEDQHLLRRNIGSDWYNRKWLETLLAMMVKVSNSTTDDFIEIPVHQSETLRIMISPIVMHSDVGYSEPNE